MIKNVYRSSCKVSAILGRFYWKVNFLHRFSQNTQIQSFMKIRPVGVELLSVDGRTHIYDEADSRF